MPPRSNIGCARTPSKIGLIKGFEVQNFEPVLSHKHRLACFTLVVRDERKRSEVNFEVNYVLDSFMDKNTKSDVRFSRPKWN